jgi:hypothetical protein
VHIIDLCIDVATGYLRVNRIYDWRGANTKQPLLNDAQNGNGILDEDDTENVFIEQIVCVFAVAFC